MSVTGGPVETDLPPVAGYHHVGLTVSDVGASEAWYGRVLGLRRVMVEQHGDGTGYAAVLARPDVPLFLGLTHHDGHGGETFNERRTGLDHLSFAVAARGDLDRWCEHLDRLGVPHSGVTERSEPFPYALVVFRDPDNIQLEVTWS